MDTETGAGSTASKGSSDAADTAPLPVLNALPGMLSDPAAFPAREHDFPAREHDFPAREQNFGQPPFVEQPAHQDPYWTAPAPPAPRPGGGPAGQPAGDKPWVRPSASAVDFASWADTGPLPSKRPLIIGGAVLAAVVLVGGVIAIFASGGSDDDPAEPAAAPVTTTASSRDADAESRLLAMLPAGYATSACKAVEPANEAVAQITCGSSEDPDGPLEASYSLVKDRSALAAGLSRLTKRNAVVVCPGRIQSPGPWRRNVTPDLVSGTVFCGSSQGNAVVGWTDEERLLLSETRGGATGPTLDQLYAWWSSHS